MLGAYAVGVFPMADARDAADVYWVEPRRRAVMPLDGFRLGRTLRRQVASDRFRVTADRAFGQVLSLCAEPAPDRPDTWINQGIERAFLHLHERGLAHSVECWDGDRLAGGLYGLAMGRAFFGESMVSRAAGASKVALAWLVARLGAGGFALLDCQFQTDHLRFLGAVEVERATYLEMLADALAGTGFAGPAGAGDRRAGGDFGALDVLHPTGRVVAEMLRAP